MIMNMIVSYVIFVMKWQNKVSDILNENRMEDQVHQYKEKVLNIVLKED